MAPHTQDKPTCDVHGDDCPRLAEYVVWLEGVHEDGQECSGHFACAWYIPEVREGRRPYSAVRIRSLAVSP